MNKSRLQCSSKQALFPLVCVLGKIPKPEAVSECGTSPRVNGGHWGIVPVVARSIFPLLKEQAIPICTSKGALLKARCGRVPLDLGCCVSRLITRWEVLADSTGSVAITHAPERCTASGNWCAGISEKREGEFV